MQQRSDFIGRSAFAILAVSGLAVATVGAAPMKRYNVGNNNHRTTDTDSWVSRRAMNIQGYIVLAASNIEGTDFLAKTRAQVETQFDTYLVSTSNLENDPDTIIILDIEYPKIFSPKRWGPDFFEEVGGVWQFKSSVVEDLPGGGTYTHATTQAQTEALFDDVCAAFEARVLGVKDALDPNWDQPGETYDGPRIALYGCPNPTLQNAGTPGQNKLLEGYKRALSNYYTVVISQNPPVTEDIGYFDEFDFVAPQCYFNLYSNNGDVDTKPANGIADPIDRAQISIDHAQEITRPDGSAYGIFPMLMPHHNGTPFDTAVARDMVAMIRNDTLPDGTTPAGIDEICFWSSSSTIGSGGYADVDEWFDEVFATGDIDGDYDNDCDDYDDFTTAFNAATIPSTDVEDLLIDYNDDGVLNNDDKHLFYNEWDPADVTTINTNPGDALYGIADGDVTTADLTYFTALHTGGKAAADLTTTGTNPGDANYGVPDGTVDTADLNYYVALWNNPRATCP